MEDTETQAIEPEVVKEETSLTKPSTPVTLAELAAEENRGVAIIEARTLILDTVRKASIAVTNPNDWILFRTKDGQVTAYLQDSGADRVRPFWGIDITVEPGPPQRTEAEDGSFAYSIRGSGHCRLTDESVSEMEGTRYSTEDFVKYDTGIQREIKVKKAARANLDGGITRELAGLKSVPIQEIDAVWAAHPNNWKKTSLCPKGRGFGSGAERAGAQVQEASHVPAGQEPICEMCGAKAKYFQAGVSKTSGKAYAAFWACPSRDHKWTISDEEYRKSMSYSRDAGSEG